MLNYLEYALFVVPTLDRVVWWDSSNLSESHIEQQERIIASAADMVTRTADLLQRMQTLLPVLETTSFENVEAFDQRCTKLQASLTTQSYQAATFHLRLSQYISVYNQVIDFTSKQFIYWDQQVTLMEKQVDKLLEQKK